MSTGTNKDVKIAGTIKRGPSGKHGALESSGVYSNGRFSDVPPSKSDSNAYPCPWGLALITALFVTVCCFLFLKSCSSFRDLLILSRILMLVVSKVFFFLHTVLFFFFNLAAFFCLFCVGFS